MKDKKISAIMIYENKHLDIDVYCKKLLETIDILIIIVCNPEYKSLKYIEEISASNLPRIVYHVSKVDHLHIFRALANSIRFFEITHHVFLPPNHVLDYTKEELEFLIQGSSNNHFYRLNWKPKGLRWMSSTLFSSINQIYGIILDNAKIQKIYSNLELGIPMMKTIKEWKSIFLDNIILSKHTQISSSNQPQVLLSNKSNSISEDKLEEASSHMINAAGAFDAEFHIQNLYLDLPAYHFIYDRYKPVDVLDLGCGIGGYIQSYQKWGADYVFGVEGFDPKEDFLVPDHFLQFDLTKPLDLGKTFDLVLCVEVIEHIESHESDNLLKSIASHARKVVVFSAGRPGQPGIGHVNCQPISFWIDKWRMLGWEPDPFISSVTRALATYHWFRRNLIVLTKIGEPKHNVKLVSNMIDPIETKQVKWTNQPPRIYANSLSEPLHELSRQDKTEI